MRLAPNTDIVPASVNRVLVPHERLIISVHRHPAVLIGPSGVVVAGLVAAIVLGNLHTLTGDALLTVWLIWGLLLLYLIGKVLSWSVDYFVITSQRLLVVKGVLARDVSMLPLIMTARMRFRRSAMGALLGYGQLIFESRGQDQAVRNVNFIPFPEQLYLELCSMVFRDEYRDDDTDQQEAPPPGIPLPDPVERPPGTPEPRDSGRPEQPGD